MKGYRISILRHGSTDANAEGRYIGVTDMPLSGEGRRALKEKQQCGGYPAVQAVYSSPLKRALESALILFPANREEIMTVDMFKELDFGEFENKTVDQLIEKAEYKAWLKGGPNASPPGGESLNQLTKRVFNGLQLILRHMMDNGFTHTALVTHSGIMTHMLAGFGLPKGQPMDFLRQPGEGWDIIINLQMWMNSGVFEVAAALPYYDSQEDEDMDTLQGEEDGDLAENPEAPYCDCGDEEP